jgi:RimJ/RimL family protein N-acetyltransferase
LIEHLSGLERSHGPDGVSILAGPLERTELHWVLTAAEDFGSPVVSVRAVPVHEEPLRRLRWPRTTDRLVIRPATPDDAKVAFDLRRRDEVSRWLTELPTDPQNYRDAFALPERIATTLVVERQGEVIGDLMLRVEDSWYQQETDPAVRVQQAELGWLIDPAHSGLGYATEAVRELIEVAFSDLALRRVTAMCFAGNDRSWQLMERVGLRRETHAIGGALHRNGTWMDTYGYALTSDEWRGKGEPYGPVTAGGAPLRQSSESAAEDAAPSDDRRGGDARAVTAPEHG